MMKKLTKALGITAALAVMIPLSAYAATAPSTNASQPDATKTTAATQKASKEHDFGKLGGFMSQDVLNLLKLDQKSLKEKLSAGKTLAQIAQDQGVTRDQLKQAVTDAFNKKLEDSKKRFADNLDKMLDGKMPQEKEHGDFGKGGEKGVFFKKNFDMSAVENLLGLKSDELKTSLSSGKSLADLAKEKGVDVQKLIDAEKNAIIASINQAVKDGKITQQQADKEIANAGKIAEKLVNGKHGFERKRVHSQEQNNEQTGQNQQSGSAS